MNDATDTALLRTSSAPNLQERTERKRSFSMALGFSPECDGAKRCTEPGAARTDASEIVHANSSVTTRPGKPIEADISTVSDSCGTDEIYISNEGPSGNSKEESNLRSLHTPIYTSSNTYNAGHAHRCSPVLNGQRSRAAMHVQVHQASAGAGHRSAHEWLAGRIQPFCGRAASAPPSWVADAPDGAERRASTCGPWRGRALQPAAAHRLGSAPATPEPGMWRSQPGTWRAPTTTPSSFGCALCDKSNGHTKSRFAHQIRSRDLRLRFAPHVFCLFLLAILSCFSSRHGYAFLVCRCRWGRVRRLQTTAI